MRSDGPTSRLATSTKLVGAFVGGLVAAGALLHLLDSPTDPAAHRMPDARKARGVGPDSPAVANLAARIRALEESLDEAAIAPAGDVPQSVAREPEFSDADDVPWEERRAEEEARADERFAFLSDRLRSEPMDRSWARQATAAIETASEDFPGTSFQHVDCRSTMCQVEVVHETTQASDRFMDYFFTRVPMLPRGSLRRLDGSDGRPRSLVFLARQGHALPRLEVQ